MKAVRCAVTGLYDVPAGIIVLLSVFYGTISVLAVAGNSLVMWIVATSRRMQNVTNCFISNLALADIVIGLFAIPFQVRALSLCETGHGVEHTGSPSGPSEGTIDRNERSRFIIRAVKLP
jgi:hypothetical protein